MHEFNTEERRNDNTNLKPPTMEVESDNDIWRRYKTKNDYPTPDDGGRNNWKIKRKRI